MKGRGEKEDPKSPDNGNGDHHKKPPSSSANRTNNCSSNLLQDAKKSIAFPTAVHETKRPVTKRGPASDSRTNSAQLPPPQFIANNDNQPPTPRDHPRGQAKLSKLQQQTANNTRGRKGNTKKAPRSTSIINANSQAVPSPQWVTNTTTLDKHLPHPSTQPYPDKLHHRDRGQAKLAKLETHRNHHGRRNPLDPASENAVPSQAMIANNSNNNDTAGGPPQDPPGTRLPLPWGGSVVLGDMENESVCQQDYDDQDDANNIPTIDTRSDREQDTEDYTDLPPTLSSNLDEEAVVVEHSSSFSQTEEDHNEDEQVEEQLAVANPVEDETSRLGLLPQAHQVDLEQLRHQKQQRKRRFKYRMAGLFMLIAIVVTILAVALTQQVSSSSPDNPTIVGIHNNTNATNLTGPPTMAPTLSLSGMVWEQLPTYTIVAIEQDPESPQARAWQWLLDDPFLDEYSLDRLIQRFALMTIYYSTNGDNWFDNTNWTSYEIHECDWLSRWFFVIGGENFQTETVFGPRLACLTNDSSVPMEDRHIYSQLFLDNNKLSGTIPPEIALLTQLFSIRMAANMLQGSLPTELGLLSKMGNELYFSSNELTGTIPSEVFQLTDIESTLGFANNKITGTIPSEIGLMTSVQSLEAAECFFSGTIPTEIGLMTSLLGLQLRGNLITGAIPTTVGLLTNMKQLFELDNNSLEGPIITELASLTSLTLLSMNVNLLTGSIPSQLGLLSSLIFFDARYNHKLNGGVPTQLGLLSNLEFLAFGVNKLTGTLPIELTNLSNLVALSFFNNSLQGTLHTELGNLLSLHTLNLDGNLFTGTVPTQLGLLPLDTMALARNNLSGRIPSELSATSLLSLHRNRLTSTLPSELAGHAGAGGMWGLYVHTNLLSGSIPSEYSALTSLERLLLSNNPRLTGSLPSGMEKFPLEILWLENTALSGSIPSGLCSIDNLLFSCSESFCGCGCTCSETNYLEEDGSSSLFGGLLGGG